MVRFASAPDRRTAASSALAACCLAACLQADTKPPPGTLSIAVSPSEAAATGTITADGWSLRFDRVLLGIGNASLDNCIAYSETRYDRVLDALSGSAQKLVILYGLGDCTLRFRVGAPSSDALVGAGVTDGDKTFMRTPGTDPSQGGVSVDITGAASQGQVEELFHWSFRHATRLFCLAGSGDASDSRPIHLESSDGISHDAIVSPEVLFRTADFDGAPLSFDPIATADRIYGDRDGVVTLDELARVALTSDVSTSAWDSGVPVDASSLVPTDGGLGYLADSDAAVNSLAAVMQNVLLSRLVHFDDGLICPPSTAPAADE